MLAQLDNPTFTKIAGTLDQAITLLRVAGFPLVCIAVLLGVLMRTRSLAALLGALFPLAVGAVFIYNPGTFQTVGSWFI